MGNAGVPRELVLVDWEWLHETGELSEADPLAQRVRAAAPRMGMSDDALERALQRAGIRKPVEPSLNPRKRTMCDECRKYRARLGAERAEVRRLAYLLQRKRVRTDVVDQLEAAKAALAGTTAQRDMHMETEHGKGQVAA